MLAEADEGELVWVLQVGYIQVDIKAQRKSGKEAWSDRRVEDVVEAPFQELCRTWGDSVPYHAIRYFKDHGLLSWCAVEQSR